MRASTLGDLIVRGPNGTVPPAPVLRESVRGLDADVPLYGVMTLEQAADNARWNGRLSDLLLTLITCIAVGLAAVGLYPVVALRHE